MLGFMERSAIKLLKKRGNTDGEIARALGGDRKTVRRALVEPADKKQQRPKRGSLVDPYEDKILQWMQEGANPFLDGLVKARYSNARYHMAQILNLLEDYPRELVESAIERAALYGAFECGAIRNICRQGDMTEAKAVPEEIELTQKTPLVSEPVEERALSYYSQLEV